MAIWNRGASECRLVIEVRGDVLGCDDVGCDQAIVQAGWRTNCKCRGSPAIWASCTEVGDCVHRLSLQLGANRVGGGMVARVCFSAFEAVCCGCFEKFCCFHLPVWKWKDRVRDCLVVLRTSSSHHEESADCLRSLFAGNHPCRQVPRQLACLPGIHRLSS